MSDTDKKTIEESVKENTSKELIDILKEFLKETNLEKIISSLNAGKQQNIDAQKGVNNKNLTFWKYKFLKEFATVLFILIAVISLAIFTDIENSTLGTLLGSIIGYSIGNFSSSDNKKQLKFSSPVKKPRQKLY